MDMTYEGVLATLLSGLEPAVAIVLACLPLLRPLFSRRKAPTNSKSGYGYNSSGGSGFYSKSVPRSTSRPFTELDDHELSDNSSEVQLHPVHKTNVQIMAVQQENDRPLDFSNIAVERKWEVTTS